MSGVKPIPVSHNLLKYPPFKPFIFKDIHKCSHVFKLVKKVKPPLVRPYTGPHKVVLRHKSGKYYKIEYNNKHKTVSIKQLKTAFLIPDNLDLPKPTVALPTTVNEKTPASAPIPWNNTPSQPELPEDPIEPKLPPPPPPLNPQPVTPPKKKKFVPNILRKPKKN